MYKLMHKRTEARYQLAVEMREGGQVSAVLIVEFDAHYWIGVALQEELVVAVSVGMTVVIQSNVKLHPSAREENMLDSVRQLFQLCGVHVIGFVSAEVP